MTQPTPTSPAPGGFLPSTGLLSPTPSHASSSTRNHISGPPLPHPRKHALRPGSSKEDLVRRYVEERMLHISRRFVKKFGIPEPGDEVVGYRSMGELCRDIEDLLNIIWLSGTPSLQIPYLLNVAGELVSWMDGFSPSPRATFSVLHKLDHCFASLLAGEDMESRDPLPGFENGLRGGMTRTDMVRCRSMAELTRVAVVEIMSRGPPDPIDEAEYENQSQLLRQQAEAHAEQQEEEGTDGEDRAEGSHHYSELDEDEEELHMDVARVYEFTLVKLGEVLGDGGGQIGGFSLDNDDEY